MKRNVEIVITPDVVRCATVVATELQAAIGLDEPWTSLNAYLDTRARLEQIKAAELTLGADFRKLKLLELGSGMGMLVTVAHKIGLDIVGSEPSANSYKSLREACSALLSANDIPFESIDRSPGEALPWPNETFDVVLSYQVLEHVRDPRRTIAEAVRVLKPGGRLYFDMPNYHSFIEGHYGIAWFPGFAHSKRVSRIFVRLNGRNPAFLDELNLVTPSRVKKWIAPVAARYVVGFSPGQGCSSPSTADVEVDCSGPALPVGERFTGLAAKVRSGVRRPSVRKILNWLGVSEHIVLVATK